MLASILSTARADFNPAGPRAVAPFADARFVSFRGLPKNLAGRLGGPRS
jgi:hypothetical protein